MLGEFWYKTCEKLGARKADDFKRRIMNSVIKVVEEKEILNKASELKCKFRKKFSFVDCHVLALSEKFNGIIITTDSSFKDLEEFKVVYLEV